MAGDDLLRSVKNIGTFVGINSFICKVSNVNNGGIIAINGDWHGLPDEQTFQYGRVMEVRKVMNKTGSASKVTRTLTGFDVVGKYNERISTVFEWDTTYAGEECLLLIEMHHFSELGKTQWLSVFGTVEPHAEMVSSEDGFVPFKFVGLANNQAIDIGAAADVAFPSGVGVTGFVAPTSNLAIPAYTGKVGIYQITETTDA